MDLDLPVDPNLTFWSRLVAADDALLEKLSLSGRHEMGGLVPFEEALAARLDLFKPSSSIVQYFLKKQPSRYGAISNTFVTAFF
ncbi:putative phosphoserine phosphatase [Helianthus anomalus]